MSLDGDDCEARERTTGISAVATADSRAVRTASGCRKLL
jgi:hypothetical protein